MHTENKKTKLLIYDVMFKAVFNKEPGILLKMIKDIFHIEEELEVVSNPFVFTGLESPPSTKSGKTYRGDMTIRLSDKSLVTIEMNYRNDKNAIDRNMIHLVRVHNRMLKSGVPDSELDKHRIRGLNLNNFRNDEDIPVENFALVSLDTNKVASYIYTICNISLVRCKELVYNISIKNLPNAVRWGAILLEEDIDKISHILGDDMLTMEEKERLLKTIEDVNDDETIMTEWMLEENARLKHEGEMAYAKNEGAEGKNKEVIINMLNMNMDYDVISRVTGKTIEKIKEIEETIE